MPEAARIECREFGHRCGDASPDLFSRTSDFRFFGRDGRLSHAILPAGPKGLKVARILSTGHAASFSEDARTALTIPLAGRSEVRLGRETCAVGAGDIFAVGPSERRSRLLPDAGGHYRSYTVLSATHREASSGSGRCWHLPDAASAGRLRQLLDLTFAAFTGPVPVSFRRAALFEALIADMFGDLLALPSRGETRPPYPVGQAGIVACAKDFMGASFADPLTTADIAAAAGVSPRHLQRAFAAVAGDSPLRLLSEMRLDQMRARLAAPSEGTTVTSAALESGLSHLGRCSEAYRRRFGELPSETLKRTRRRHG
ncbi:AraC family transcriptional regulator [Poseidonocella sp. HB161398]|uniref:AraC family transcriptional regulator n=1 Tax=Poseidonocella sp. HB161398 TaxID=2320855 RepID=UPI0011093999|nr:AraC family transcriptional regulator [Poseidonocella sp. HB161398]